MDNKAKEIKAVLGEPTYTHVMGSIILIARNDPDVTQEHFDVVADTTAKLWHTGRSDIAQAIDNYFEYACEQLGQS